MSYWKVGAHWRTLILYVLFDGAAVGLCFYRDFYMGLLAAVLCGAFTILRLAADMAHHASLRRVERQVRGYLAGGEKPELPRGRRDEVYELRRQLYKLELALENRGEGNERERATGRAVLSDLAGHLSAMAGALEGDAAGELVSLSEDVAHLAVLWEDAPEGAAGEETFVSAKDVFSAAYTGAKAYLSGRNVKVVLPDVCKVYLTGGGEVLSDVFSGVLKACARAVPAGATLTCMAVENPSFVELSVVSESFPWQDRDIPALTDPAQGADTGFVVLTALAESRNGSVQIGRLRGAGMRVGVRFFKTAM